MSADTVQFEVVASGLDFPEGPVVMADGSIILVELHAERLVRVTPDGAKETIAHMAGGPNGAAAGPDGSIWVCNNGGAWLVDHDDDGRPALRLNEHYVGGSLQRVDPATGEFEAVYDSCEGRPLISPNDLVFDGDGGLWFTCFGFSDGETRRQGGIYYARADGSHITRVRGDQTMPNGICLSPDGRTLYWVDSTMQKLWAVDILGRGEVSPATRPAAGRTVVTMPGMTWPDGIAAEASGRICMAMLYRGVIAVVDPASGEVTEVQIPDENPTNLAFGGEDMRDLWVTGTSTSSLYRARWPRPGLRLSHGA